MENILKKSRSKLFRDCMSILLRLARKLRLTSVIVDVDSSYFKRQKNKKANLILFFARCSSKDIYMGKIMADKLAVSMAANIANEDLLLFKWYHSHLSLFPGRQCNIMEKYYQKVQETVKTIIKKTRCYYILVPQNATAEEVSEYIAINILNNNKNISR